jgi:hypothetical protein
VFKECKVISPEYSNMPCGCGKKNTGGTVHFMGRDGAQIADPTEWGPILWKYLHCLSEKLGTSGSHIIDTDQANYMETLLTLLPLILPCLECQAHAAAYVGAHPVPTLKGQYGTDLRGAARNWLFEFHNEVRSRKGQPVILNSPDECSAHYAGCFVPNCEYSLFIQSVAFSVRQGWVRVDNWRKWYSNSERLRVLVGNVVM